MGSPRRTLSTLLGVLLAVTFISGTFIAIDSSTRALMGGFLSQAESDFVVTGRTDDADGLVRAIRDVPGVTRAAPYGRLRFAEVGTWDGPGLEGIPGLTVDPASLPNLLAHMVLLGNMTLERGEAVVSATVAGPLGLTPGDGLYLKGEAFNETTQTAEARFLNLTVEGVLAPSDPPWSPSFAVNLPPQTFVAVHIDDGEWVQEQLGELSFPRLDVEVFIDRDALLDPYDRDGSQRNLERLKRSLEDIAFAYNGHVSDVVSSPFGNVRAANVILRILFLGLSLPLILLALYLGAIGVDLGHAERRRELALVRTRGGDRRQILMLLILESVLVGLLASLLGLAAGLGLSRLFLGSVTAFAGTAPDFGDVFLSLGTVATTLGLSIAFVLVVSYRSAKRTARLAVVETLRHYAPGETRTDYRPTTDLLLVAIGGGIAGAVLLGPSLGGLLAFLSGGLAVALMPVVPVLLILGLTRLATRSTGRVYEGAANVLKPLAPNLHHLIARNLARNPRRASNVAVVIALGLAFGVLTFALFASQAAWDERALRATVGAELSAIAPPGQGDFVDRVAQLQGVAGVTLVEPTSAEAPELFRGVIALDPWTYFDTVRPEPWFLGPGGVDEAREVLATEGLVLVSEAYRAEFLLEVGDSLPLRYDALEAGTGRVESRSLTVTVGGVVRGLPGTVESARFLPQAVYGGRDTLRPILEEGAPAGETEFESGPEAPKALVDLLPDADWRLVKQEVLALGAVQVTALEEARMGTQDLTRNAFLGFIQVETGFSVVVVTAGLGLIVYAASLERRGEFAGITARGASQWQTAGILLGEGITILLIAFGIGVAVGLAASHLAVQAFLVGPGQSEPLVPFTLTLPLDLLFLLGAAALVMVVTTLLISWGIARMDVARALRIRGG